MTRMYAIVWRYSRSKGIRKRWLTPQQTTEVIAVTNVTATPIPIALSLFFDTPMNGQRPMNCTSMKFWIKTYVMTIPM